MTTQPTPAQQAAELFREEIRAAFDLLHVEIAEIRADLAQMREGLTHASQPAPTPAGMTEIIQATRITKTRTSGKDYYKILGGRYTKRGVTIWKEGLEALQLDPALIPWDETDGYTFPKPINVTVLLKEYIDEDDNNQKKTTPQKVIGKA